MSSLKTKFSKAQKMGYGKAAAYFLDKKIKTVYLKLSAKLFKTQPQNIVFLNFSGSYDCNPKWICEELIKRDRNYHIVWGMQKDTDAKKADFPSQVTPYYRYNIKFINELAKAGIIIDNGISLSLLEYPKRQDQILIETWHGSLGIKRFDAESNKDKKWVARAKKEAKLTDYIISNSSFEDQVYRESFWKETPIWRYGHARNDILLSHDKEWLQSLSDKIRQRYGVGPNQQICMYGPTFRDDMDVSPYTLDYERLRNALSKRFGGEWIIFARFHRRVKELLNDYSFPDFVVNVSDYCDIQELSAIVDVGMTDYSSWLCEYILTGKPGFIYASDENNYLENDRLFLFPLKDLPFPVANDEQKLEENILLFNENLYRKKCMEFLEEHGCVDDGHAAKRIVDEIIKLTNEKN